MILTELSASFIANNFASNFWNKLGDTIVEELKKAPTSTQQILETEFPKLLKCYSELTAKLNYDQYVYKYV